MPCVKASSLGKLLRMSAIRASTSGSPIGDLARARFLREQVIGDELFEDAAQDLVALFRRHRTAGARLRSA
jgi:hypothetical protein